MPQVLRWFYKGRGRTFGARDTKSGRKSSCIASSLTGYSHICDSSSENGSVWSGLNQPFKHPIAM